jgi:two-component system CheB/CheR fusion protein
MAEEILDSTPDEPSDHNATELNEEALASIPQTNPRSTPTDPVVTDVSDGLDGSKPLPFNVVGLGASAGGVEAYIDLFEHLPVDTGMAFIVVLHLPSDQKSYLPEIISRHTQIPVVEIENSMRLEPNHVYVVPPSALARIRGGVLHLEPLDNTKRVIDFFFYSLAIDQKNRAIGIILSGMDSDGALGMRAIKGEGGITIVQAPESARYPDMPRSSISADHIDIVSTPRAIAAQLAQLGRQFRESSIRLLQEGVPPDGEEQHFGRILGLMRSVSGVDFRLYKPSTVRRRIARRMLLHRIDTLRDYLAFLQANPSEVRDLQEDALINVTRFFRDPEVFEAFKTTVLPQIFQDRDSSQQVRIWVAGCSSGEETYSLAICLLEYLTNISVEPPIQIFGTDASESSIQKARNGLYPETIVAEVSPERLRRFFIKKDKGYQVTKRVRDLCIFARQNLCHDPPFSRMDVISCRNVLIYFGAELQRQLIPTFHYALRHEGFLLLGKSETIREFTDLFSMVDRKHKIYSRTATKASRAALIPVSHHVAPEFVYPGPAQQTDVWGDIELQRAVDRILLARYAPPALVVSERMEILQTRGRMGPFLEMRPGAATLDLMRMARDNITAQLGSAVRRAIEQGVPVQVEGLNASEGGVPQQITLEVLPIQSVGHRSRCYLVVFAPAAKPRTFPPEPTPEISQSAERFGTEDKDRIIGQLQHDLSSTKTYLQSLLEERDAKNQELQSANEEIQSAYEELQSTNEELESTKEELQSSNEELHTVNDELQNRNAVLTQASNDLLNLLNSVNLPLLMLSSGLSIRHFTPPTQRVMNLRATDVGRPFSELRINLDVQDLTPIFHQVLETLTPQELEVQDRDGHWYLLRVRPYRTTDNKIDGLVVALVDIDQIRRSRQELRAARDFSRSVIAGIPLPLAVVDSELKIRTINQAFSSLTGMHNGELDRQYLPTITSNLWGLGAELRNRLEALARSKQSGENFEFQHSTNAGTPRVFIVRGCVLQPDEEQYFLVTIEDITAHAEAERVLKGEKERLTAEVEAKTQALSRSQEELRALAVSLFTSQEEERRRIARELHDDISQRLAAIEIDADKIDRSMETDLGAAHQAIAQIRPRVAQLSEDVRTMSHRLHPSIIEDLGLRAALRTLTEEFGQRENMIATFSSENVSDEVSLETATGLYRITQEALRNVAKHAGKTHARVSLKETSEGLQLQIADFGHGFDLESGHHGLGLISMEERARHIGGSLELWSALGEGTRVTITVPAAKSGTTI